MKCFKLNILLNQYFLSLGLAFVLCFPEKVKAQNLIPNPSFELFNDYEEPLLDTSESYFPGVLNWWSPTLYHGGGMRSDSIENRQGHINIVKARTGQAHASIAIGGNMTSGQASSGGVPSSGKSFYQCGLVDSLKKGCYYRFGIFLLPESQVIFSANFNPHTFAGDRMGFYFSRNRIRDTTGTNSIYGLQVRYATLHHFASQLITPQLELPKQVFVSDTITYTNFSGVFKASGGEKYLTIGNFASINSTLFKNLRTGNIVSTTPQDTSPAIRAIFYIDDLSLIKVAPPDSLLTVSADTIICPGDSLLLQAQTIDTSHTVIWDDGSTLKDRYISAPGTYWVELNCGCDVTLIDTIIISQRPDLPSLNLSDTSICKGETVQYNLNPSLSYTLNGQAVSHNFNISDTGQFYLDVSDGCYDTTYLFSVQHIITTPLPEMSDQDFTLCSGEEWAIELPTGLQYSLNGEILSGKLLLTEVGDYSLEVSNECESDIFEFSVNNEGCETLLFVPNAFTPDGDGLNDCFDVSVIEQLSYHIMIFTRWGQMVFESTNPENCWDGSHNGKIQAGVYTYRIIVQAPGRKIDESGIVQVVR